MKNQFDNLIDTGGQPRYGLFDQPVTEVNYRDFAYNNVMDQAASRLKKHFSFKQFQFIGVCSERFILGCALVDIKYLGNAFVYLYDREQRQLYEHRILLPLAFNTHLGTQPDHGISEAKRGSAKIRITSRSEPREKYVQIQIGSEFSADFTVTEPAGYQPLALSTPTGFNGWTYTQKAAGLRASGCFQLRGQRHIFGENSYGNYDWSCGFMRRETAWKWASLSGTTREGDTVGANFANGVNETGFTENAFWIDGQMTKVNQIRFTHSPSHRTLDWQIKSDDGKVDLTFTPEGKRCEKLDVFILATNFTQLFGRFHGTLCNDQGKTFTLKGTTGFCEDHYAKW
ncbi:conserved hypothetical protein [gamma proteobacterium HdN1]|nr:conserved hypothetical protein [gamma proteobacterium HdN1]